MDTYALKNKGHGIKIAPRETAYAGKVGTTLKDMVASLEKMKRRAEQALEKDPVRR